MSIITLHARRWFQSSQGNTYHSVSIEIDGMPIVHLSPQYGFGDQYIQTAYAWLKDAGYLGEPNVMSKAEFSRKHGDGFYVTDVPRKRDL